MKNNIFPKTRYQGSKYKLREWISENLKEYKFDTVLDAFSGTCSISYMFKQMGKEVYSNDYLKFNSIISEALIVNKKEKITDLDFQNILIKKENFKYSTFIKDNFHDIYYTDEENEWLDIVVQNILNLKNKQKQSMFFWALYQSCISKRPYNLFHRKNLYVRMADVKRNFGNKTTWDKKFEDHFYKFVKEINNAIFDNKRNNKSFNLDVFDIDVKVDLVYLDTPYIPSKGSITKYYDFYHFLEGMSKYDKWDSLIDYNSNNLKLKSEYTIWEDKKNIKSGFKKLIEKFKNSIIVISYRNDGIPSIEEIKTLLEGVNKKVTIKKIDYNYVFSNKKDLKEVLIIGV